jgi:hypothetical protein
MTAVATTASPALALAGAIIVTSRAIVRAVTTAVATVTSQSLFFTANQGDSNNREKDRDSEN